MNLQKLAFLFTLLLINTILFGQTNFQIGHIVNASGDKIIGLIDNRDWAKNPDKISFKVSENSIIQRLTPDDIRSFSVDDDLYIAANVKVSPLPRLKRTNTPEFEFDMQKVFLRKLIAGEKSLFTYKSVGERLHFYIEQQSNYRLLEFKEYTKSTVGATIMVAKNNKYKGQLALYFSDCDDIQKRLSTVNYSTKSLMKIFYQYYECTGVSNVEKKEAEKTRLINLIAGVNLTKLKFNKSGVGGLKSSYQHLSEPTFKSSIGFNLGISVEFLPERNQQKWILATEVLYSSFKYDWEYDQIRNENDYELGAYLLEYSYLKFSPMIRYIAYSRNDISFFINVGGLAGYVVHEINEKQVFDKFYVDERAIQGNAVDKTRKVEVGFNMGVGIKYNHFLFEIRYEQTTGMSNISGMTSSVNYNYFLVGYRLNK